MSKELGDRILEHRGQREVWASHHLPCASSLKDTHKEKKDTDICTEVEGDRDREKPRCQKGMQGERGLEHPRD